MATNVTTIYDTILTALGTLFPNKTRVPNTISLPNNAEQFLRNGYGLRVDSATFAQSEWHTFSMVRDFAVIFTRQVYKTGSQQTAYDATIKALLEDVVTVQKDFYNVDEIGIDGNIRQVNLGSVSGAEEFVGDNTNFLAMEVTFSIEINEIL